MSDEGLPKKGGAKYWLLPIFLTWIGGIISYVILKDDNPKLAKKTLIVGLILSVVWPVIVITFFFGSQFAAETGMMDTGMTDQDMEILREMGVKLNGPNAIVEFTHPEGYMPEPVKGKTNTEASLMCANTPFEKMSTRNQDWCVEFTVWLNS